MIHVDKDCCELCRVNMRVIDKHCLACEFGRKQSQSKIKQYRQLRKAATRDPKLKSTAVSIAGQLAIEAIRCAASARSN